MNILAAIKREERKREKQLHKLNHQLSGVRAAAKALGGSAEREVVARGLPVHHVHERRALRPPRSPIAISPHRVGFGTLRQRTVACVVDGSLPRVFSWALNQPAV
jgi:hypothetical protein